MAFRFIILKTPEKSSKDDLQTLRNNKMFFESAIVKSINDKDFFVYSKLLSFSIFSISIFHQPHTTDLQKSFDFNYKKKTRGLSFLWGKQLKLFLFALTQTKSIISQNFKIVFD